jgi:speckle-type POZ protein
MWNTDTIENQQSEVKILDADDSVIAGMLDWMYTGCSAHLRNHSNGLLQIAEKYNLLDLKEQCEAVLISDLHVNNSIEMLVLGDCYSSALKQNTIHFINK